MTIARNAASMKVFHFGAIRPHPRGRGTVGDYALHIQCAWRIVKRSQIVTGSADLYRPRAASEAEPENPREGLQEHLLEEIFTEHDEATHSLTDTTRTMIVQSVSADDHGGLEIMFSGDLRLQIFPNGSGGEDWRLLGLDNPDRHFVVSGGVIVEK
jgi:hypothetical protein